MTTTSPAIIYYNIIIALAKAPNTIVETANAYGCTNADVIVQILHSAALTATTNFENHISTNFYSRTTRWIRLQLNGQAHFANLEARRVSSWVSLLVRAASGGDADIQTLLCSYTSLVQPPPDVMEWLEFLVATMQSLLRPLPVTDLVLKKQPWCYLSWLHLVLTDFEATQNTPRAPKTSLGAAEQQPNRLHRNQYHRPALVIWTHQSKVYASLHLYQPRCKVTASACMHVSICNI